MADVEYFNDIWSIYFHSPNDTEWDIKSYKFICTISNVREFACVYYTFREQFHKGMFFIMREHITPRWEDESNQYGGCFSYKISKNLLDEKFFDICAQVLGETIGKDDTSTMNVNGISISPKKNYYIIRVWIKDNKYASFKHYNIDVPRFSTLMYKNHSDDKDI